MKIKRKLYTNYHKDFEIGEKGVPKKYRNKELIDKAVEEINNDPRYSDLKMIVDDSEIKKYNNNLPMSEKKKLLENLKFSPSDDITKFVIDDVKASRENIGKYKDAYGQYKVRKKKEDLEKYGKFGNLVFKVTKRRAKKSGKNLGKSIASLKGHSDSENFMKSRDYRYMLNAEDDRFFSEKDRRRIDDFLYNSDNEDLKRRLNKEVKKYNSDLPKEKRNKILDNPDWNEKAKFVLDDADTEKHNIEKYKEVYADYNSRRKQKQLKKFGPIGKVVHKINDKKYREKGKDLGRHAIESDDYNSSGINPVKVSINQLMNRELETGRLGKLNLEDYSLNDHWSDYPKPEVINVGVNKNGTTKRILAFHNGETGEYDNVSKLNVKKFSKYKKIEGDFIKISDPFRSDDSRYVTPDISNSKFGLGKKKSKKLVKEFLEDDKYRDIRYNLDLDTYSKYNGLSSDIRNLSKTQKKKIEDANWDERLKMAFEDGEHAVRESEKIKNAFGKMNLRRREDNLKKYGKLGDLIHKVTKNNTERKGRELGEKLSKTVTHHGDKEKIIDSSLDNMIIHLQEEGSRKEFPVNGAYNDHYVDWNNKNDPKIVSVGNDPRKIIPLRDIKRK